MRRREIFIELTSLLDVILIMLFVLLTQARAQTGEALESAAAAGETVQSLQTALAETEQERDSLADRLGAMERREITLGVVEENSFVLTLSVQGDEERSVLAEPEGGTPLRIPIDPEDTHYSENRLRTSLSGLLRGCGKETAFLVFQYDRGRIYQADYAMIGAVVRELKQEAGSAGIALNYIETDITKGTA